MTRDREHSGAMLSVGSVLGPLVVHRTFLMTMVVLGLLLGVLHSVFAPRIFEARTTILPNQGSSTSLLGGASELALMAGITLPGGVEPSLFYQDLLYSAHLLERVLDAQGPAGITILESLGFEDDLGERDKAIHRLKRSLDVTRDSRSGVVSIKARASDPVLAEAIIDRLVHGLDEFMRSRRRTDAGNRHGFLLQEIGRSEATLSDAEDRLAEFRTDNRMIDQSPVLQREQAALNREVLFREAVVVELRKQAEFQAITAQEDLPSISTIGPPRAGSKPVRPIPAQSVVAGVLVLGALACMVIYFRSGVLPNLRKELAPDRA